jgi:diguanylate cyclase (GGDEF)-like protein
VFAVERHRRAQRAEHTAVTDPLTDLPNVALFRDRLAGANTRARRAGTLVALLFLDLDEFKPINDQYSHPVGDAVLRKVAQRLTRSIRSADTVARIGGDEFCVVLEDIGNTRSATKIGRELVTLISKPTIVRSRALDLVIKLSVSCSIGIALFPDHGVSVREVVRYADRAMYVAKRESGDSVRVFEPDIMSPDSSSSGLGSSRLTLDSESSSAKLRCAPSESARRIV